MHKPKTRPGGRRNLNREFELSIAYGRPVRTSLGIDGRNMYDHSEYLYNVCNFSNMIMFGCHTLMFKQCMFHSCILEGRDIAYINCEFIDCTIDQRDMEFHTKSCVLTNCKLLLPLDQTIEIEKGIWNSDQINEQDPD